MYYLQSRYYNCEFGRFINADGTIGANGDILSNNLFAYCSNNSVNNYDPTGEWSLPNWAKIAIGVAAITIGVIATVATGGAALPALIGALEIVAVSVAVSVAVKITTNIVKTVVSGGSVKEIKKNALKGTEDAAADGVMWGGISAGVMMCAQAGLQIAGSGINSGGKTQGLYSTPRTPGGTIISTKFKSGNKFRIDLDSINGLHFHFGRGKSLKTHNIIIPWVFGSKVP